ncbi:M48 family metallopeptidase [Falsiporphyromonas endometrii]|uniref:M48 family metallopeptidase n=1 Tax=Falsiporphyromonas endometrii TaxID=1387297 RepID=A0ABV9K9X0_9PORP
MNKIGRILVSLALGGLFLTSCSVVPITGRRQLSLVPDTEIMQSSLAQYRSFVNQAPRSRNTTYNAMVDRVGRKVAAATDAFLRKNNMASMANQMQWEFNTIESNQINAFCMPGGKIVVYTGLLKLVNSDDELACVIGHEVSHAVAKHSNERLSQEVLRQLGGQVLGVAVSNKNAALQQVIGQAYGLGTQLFVALPYGRKQEYEADKMGLVFMTMAGYNPNAAINFWKKMSAKSGGNQNELLSTHPSDAHRIAELQKYMPEALKYAPQGGPSKIQQNSVNSNKGGSGKKSKTSDKWHF